MNFEYLKNNNDFEKLYELCNNAESLVFDLPNLSIASARKAIEYVVKFIYPTYLKTFTYDMTLLDMINDTKFKDFLNDDQLLNSIHYIRKMGNIAVHEDSLNTTDAINVLEELHFVISELCILFEIISDYENFVEPTKIATSPKNVETEIDKPIEIDEGIIAKFATKLRYTKFNVKHKRDELENKKLFLEASLRESDWAIVNKENVVMPASASINLMLDNNNKEDYVLSGRDNKPLAIIEFTETCKNLLEGRKKAIEKANIIELKYGYKPIIYYTNGYVIYCIDQLGYGPRRVFNFHTIEELELLKLRQTLRQDISNPIIDDNITNRYYQKEAIKAACSAFSSLRRKSLLVMATGTGKTRVSISLVDVLMKAGWIKNILFLADRTSLVKQAHKNFNKLLPNVTTSIYAGGGLERDSNARIIFSTYQTMINLVNDDTKEFSVGRFDLIIIDEAHRSIFKKYKTLFTYFDALMLGLTATPRTEENKNTYDIFELPNGEPDYAYELEQAVLDKYLVGYEVIDNTTEAIRDGINYDDLPDDVKEKIENDYLDDEYTDNYGLYYRPVHRIINLGTIDIMLNELLKNGLKVDGGDKLGKTIIFAPSHQYAVQIVERFNKVYGYLGKDFCKLVDSQMDDSQNTIERFEIRESMPQICVSVDMMDTGIDVPDVLNLVFFKTVKSKIKFLQMIGRGTRLSENIYGAEMHKDGFLIFDYFNNFEYFNTKTQKLVNKSPSQSYVIYQRKLNILKQLQDESNLNDFEKNYLVELKNYFINTLNCLCNDDIAVQSNIAFVNKYRTKEVWDDISDIVKEEIENRILPILPSISDPMKIKSFDQIMYFIEEKYKEKLNDLWSLRCGFGFVKDAITRRMVELLKMKTIPEVMNKKELLNKMINADYIFNSPSLEMFENVRKELRDLMTYLPEHKEYYVVDIEDKLVNSGTIIIEKPQKSYVERVVEYLSSSKEIALSKLSNLNVLTQVEKDRLNDIFNSEIGTQEECTVWCNNIPLLQRIRMEVGIDDNAIQTKFGAFLNLNVLTQLQLTFMNQIISYAKINGDFSFKTIQQVSPFCDTDITKLFGTNSVYLKDLINGIHKPIL